MTVPRTLTHKDIMKEFNLSISAMRKLWKDMPHDYIGQPKKMLSIRSARFNMAEVAKWINNRRVKV